MLQLPQIPLGSIEEYLAVAAILLWSSISLEQLIKAKLHKQRCIICNNSVTANEQAQNVPVPCHARCRYIARLLA